MDELIYILLMTSGVLLWTLGGWRNKVFRRFILPLVIGGLLYFIIDPIKAGIVTVLAIGVTHLGYGENTPWIVPFKVVNGSRRSSKLLTALSYNLPSLVIGWSMWLLITPAVFMITFLLSNLKFTRKDFVWKVVEGIIGLLFTINLIGALQRQW